MIEDDDELSGLPEPPLLSADDDAYVSALLADLPDVPMPADVGARIDAALADLAGAPAPSGAATVLPGGVIPITAARSRWRNPRILQAAAAVVLVVAAVSIGIQSMSKKDSAGSNADGGASSATRSEAAVASGTAYTTDTLAAGIRRLVAQSGRTATTGGLLNSKSGGSQAPQVPSPNFSGSESTASGPPAATPSDAAALAFSLDALAACISVIEDSPTYTQPIAIDAATYNGQQALLVVLPNSDQPSTYGVWIVQPTCGQGGDAHVINYTAVPRT